MAMHGMEYFNITDAQQAGLVNNSKSTKYELLKTKAAVWFNNKSNNFHSCTVRLDVIKVFYLPTDAQ
jgi:Holliday junction resolvase-like predicted endonuclease